MTYEENRQWLTKHGSFNETLRGRGHCIVVWTSHSGRQVPARGDNYVELMDNLMFVVKETLYAYCTAKS